MLTALSDAGKGDLIVHENKQWIDFDTGGYTDADITVDALLADPVVLEASQNAQSFIDQEVEKIMDEVGLTDDEVIEIPNLFNQVDLGSSVYHVAYQPGTVNMLVFGDYVVIPKPFGPKDGGEDVIRDPMAVTADDEIVMLSAVPENSVMYLAGTTAQDLVRAAGEAAGACAAYGLYAMVNQLLANRPRLLRLRTR